MITTSTKTILLINSELNVQEVLQAYLAHFGGWQILKASSPLYGLASAAQAQPDAILFDLSTFGMNFFSFLKRLRSRPETENIPVVFLVTGVHYLDYDMLKNFQIAGIIDYFIDPASIAQQVAKLLAWDEIPQFPEVSTFGIDKNASSQLFSQKSGLCTPVS
jgi:CheY-like chemotaxis protein